MSPMVLVLILLLLSLVGYYLGRSRAVATADGRVQELHSLPSYYGLYIALWALLPGLLLILIWLFIEPIVIDALVASSVPYYDDLTGPQQNLLLVDIKNLAAGSIVSREADEAVQNAAAYYNSLSALSNWMLFAIGAGLAALALWYTRRQIEPRFRARNNVEQITTVLLIICSTIAIFTTVGIVLSLLFESYRFFTQIPFHEFLFGLSWSPQIALRADQFGSSGAFGAVPLFAGTLLIAFIAMVVAAPVGLMAAVYLAEYAPMKVRSSVKPILEILAGIPTVVYGFFAILTVAPVIRDFGNAIGLDASSNSALAAGLVMGVMIVPFVSSLSDDVINSVPQSLREGSYGLGATKSETIRQIILPAALPGIVGALLLAVSRAIGETMIVVMAAGLAANLTLNPFDAVTTVTVQIATLLVGDQEFDNAKTLSAFALGLVLFIVTLGLNVIALRVVQKYREKYD